MHYLTSADVARLELQANEIRQSIIEMLFEAKSGHTAGPLDMADIFTLLYFEVLQHDPKIRIGKIAIAWYYRVAISARSSTPRSPMLDIFRYLNS